MPESSQIVGKELILVAYSACFDYQLNKQRHGLHPGYGAGDDHAPSFALGVNPDSIVIRKSPKTLLAVRVDIADFGSGHLSLLQVDRKAVVYLSQDASAPILEDRSKIELRHVSISPEN